MSGSPLEVDLHGPDRRTLGPIPGGLRGVVDTFYFVPKGAALQSLRSPVRAELSQGTARWVTTAYAARVAGISQRQIRKLASRGDLRARKSGRRWLVSLNALLVLLDGLAE